MSMKIFFIFILVVALMCSVSVISAVDYNDTVDNVMSEVGSRDEFISVCDVEQSDNIDSSVLSAQDENDNWSTTDNEVLSLDSNDNSYLGVTTRETNKYLDDIKSSTSDEFFKFVNYLVKQKRFKFNNKSSDDGYSIYSTSKYQSKLFDGENYVLPAKNSYFLSKNRMGYMILDEYYPDVLYIQNNHIYLDELYLGWLKNVENYHFTLTVMDSNDNIVRSGVTFDDFGNGVMNDLSVVKWNSINSLQEKSNLPSVFDLRNVNGQNYVTSVKNQGENYANCWAFASIAAIESYLLKTEGKTYELCSYDFSENNMKNVMSSIGKQGADFLVNGGGRDNMVLAYLLRWSGPVLEEFDKYNLSNMNNVPLEFANVAKHVQGIKYIHARNESKDNEEIKQAIYDYGGVVTSMYWVKSNKYEHNDTYYYYETTTGNMWHEICIIGWDDNYPKEKFSKTAPGNGAFLIKNSYGEDDGKYGYYWVSYFDTTLARRTSIELANCTGFSFTLIENNTNYGKNYNNNPLGVTGWYSTGVNDLYYYSEWVADDDETLKACGVYINDACNCSIKVFVDNNLKEIINTISLNYAGFHTIQFTNPVPVKKGQKFKIQVNINSKSQVYIPFESNGVPYSKVDVNFNKAKFYTNGLYYFNNADICLNVYTEYNMFSDAKLETVDAIYINGVFEVKTKLLDANGNTVKNFELICGVEVSEGNVDYMIGKTDDNGEVTLSFKNGVKINDDKISVSFNIYDACHSVILTKTVEIINVPNLYKNNGKIIATETSIQSIKVGNSNKIETVAVRMAIGSITVTGTGEIGSIIVEGTIYSIIVEGCAKIGSILVGGDIKSIDVKGSGKIGSIVVGGSIGYVSVNGNGEIGLIAVDNSIGFIVIGNQGQIKSILVGNNIKSILIDKYSKIQSIIVGGFGNIGTITVNGGEIEYIYVGNSTGAIIVTNSGEIQSFIVDGNTDSITVERWGKINSLTIGEKVDSISVSGGGKIKSQVTGVGGSTIKTSIEVSFKRKENVFILSR